MAGEGVTVSDKKYHELTERYFELKKEIKIKMDEMKDIHEQLLKLEKETPRNYRESFDIFLDILTSTL